MKKRTSLIIAVVLLLLPVLYVGSYLALVLPAGQIRSQPADFPKGAVSHRFTHYRIGYEFPDQFFKPLERIDRRIRPDAWSEPPKMFRPQPT